MTGVLRVLRERRPLLQALVGRELKARYKGSALGVIWSLATPLMMSCTYMFFFHYLAGRGAPVESILIGIFAWQFTASSAHQGLLSITGNGNLVKKVAFPRELLPAAVTTGALIDYLISLLVQVPLITFLLLRKDLCPQWTVLLLPLPLLLHALVNFSLAMLLGSLNTVFRDTQHFTGPGLTILFFLTPAMYDHAFIVQSAIDPRLADLSLLNPLAAIFSVYRALVLPGVTLPDTPMLWVGLALPFLFAPLAWAVFRKWKKDFADYV